MRKKNRRNELKNSIVQIKLIKCQCKQINIILLLKIDSLNKLFLNIIDVSKII